VEHAPRAKKGVADDEDGEDGRRLKNEVQPGDGIKRLEVGIGKERHAKAEGCIPLRQAPIGQAAHRPLDSRNPVEEHIALKEGTESQRRLPVQDDNRDEEQQQVLRGGTGPEHRWSLVGERLADAGRLARQANHYWAPLGSLIRRRAAAGCD
jgi:hypothetical protein